MSGFNEKKYWAELRQGNMDSLKKLYDRYVDDLFRYGMGISADKSSVMDGIHDLFLNLYKYHKRIDEVRDPKAYLFQSLKRTLHKKRGNKTITLENNEVLNSLPRPQKISQSHEAHLIALERTMAIKAKVNRALNLLSQNQQKVLHMRFEEDKSYKEIAESMSVSIPSARTTIYRALKILRNGVMTLIFALS